MITELILILAGMIVGWQIGLPLLHVGDSATLYIPSGLAYGTAKVGSVPPKLEGFTHIVATVGAALLSYFTTTR